MNKDFDSIKLENNKEYVITDEIKYNDIEYFSLTNLNDLSDIKIRKVLDENNIKVLSIIDDETELKEVLNEFNL